MQERIEIGFQVFLSDGGEEFGAVRQISPQGRPELVIYIENTGDVSVSFDAIKAVHSQKVLLDSSKLDPYMREAIAKAHKSEVPGK
jgi:archaellum component FlaG (FlaF/FlaG flagellin family)